MAILGAVLGDILGAQYEFDRPKDLDWKNVPLLGAHGVGFTDDSVMALAIKKALDELSQFCKIVDLCKLGQSTEYDAGTADFLIIYA